MKTLTRRNAVAMFQHLSQMAIGHLCDADMEAALDNIAALRTVADQYAKLAEELHRRIFEDVDEQRCRAFDSIVREHGMDAVGEEYADIKALVEKKVSVMYGLESREVAVELRKVERKAFMMAVLKAQPATPQTAFNVLAPMFEDDEAETDMAELDELLKG